MKKIAFFSVLAIFLLTTCRPDKKSAGIEFISPEAGTSLRAGSEVLLDLNFDGEKIDSVVYLIDSTVVARKTDTSAVKGKTENLQLGNHLLTAKVYSAGQAQEITSNIVLLAANAPQQYSFKVINTYPHDTTSYIEGLEYHDGLFYESDGGRGGFHGGSSLRTVNPQTGKIVKKVNIDGKYFAEGLTVIDQKIIQLTYTEGIGFVYDKATLKKISEFPYTAGREGWGLCFDGKNILNTDGSNNIYILNKNTYQKESSIAVYDNNGPVDQLNELEFIDGKIFANVYTKPWILIINSRTGAVEGKADLTQLLPRGDDGDYVLNGIAWDEKGKRLYVTGKLWDKLYEIKLEPLK